jgi:hypothetical protein
MLRALRALVKGTTYLGAEVLQTETSPQRKRYRRVVDKMLRILEGRTATLFFADMIAPLRFNL